MNDVTLPCISKMIPILFNKCCIVLFIFNFDSQQPIWSEEKREIQTEQL